MNRLDATLPCSDSPPLARSWTASVVNWLRRRVEWRRVSIAFSLMLIAIACLILFRAFGDLDLAKVEAAAQAISVQRVLLALGLVAASFVTLAFYDFFALRTIGHQHIPLHVAAIAGLLSYSIGHGIGAIPITSGFVRYRVYFAWGLRLVDVAKIGFVTGLMFWLGNIALLGISLAYAPEIATQIDYLPAWVNRFAAIGALAAILCYLVWLALRPRRVGRNHWQITLPNPKVTLVQIGMGVLDLSLAAMALYVLLPATPSVPFVTVLVTFVVASLLGFISHAPSGLGVFDAAVLVGLARVEPAELLASLLIFRLLYSVLPLCLASLLLILHEIVNSGRRKFFCFAQR